MSWEYTKSGIYCVQEERHLIWCANGVIRIHDDEVGEYNARKVNTSRISGYKYTRKKGLNRV